MDEAARSGEEAEGEPEWCHRRKYGVAAWEAIKKEK